VQIDAIRSLWLDAAVVIAENGSTDSTKQLLATYAATKSQTHVLTLDAEANFIPSRTERLALVRNRLLDFVHTTYPTFDYILSVDLDGILDGFKSSGLASVFKFPVDTWDAVFANVTGKYYDIWALRSSEMGITYDCWDMIRHLQLEGGVSRADAKAACVTQFQTVIKASPSRLLPVESAFGGLGLYRLAATRGCAYVGHTQECSCQQMIAFNRAQCASETCEHVAFHKDMVTKGAKLFICSSLLVKTQQEHL